MMKNLSNVVGERLSELLKDDKQDNMAKKLNVGQGTVSKWKTGEHIPNPETLVDIAVEYDVSLDWLLGISDVKERNNLSSDRISYAQVIAVLDRLFRLENIEVLNFSEAAKDKKFTASYSNDESLKNDTDYIKVNDMVLSYLLRRRKVIYDFDESMAKDWVDKCIEIFKNQTTLNYNDSINSVIESKPLSTFKEAEWKALVEEINGMSDEQIKEYLEKKKEEKEGRENG